MQYLVRSPPRGDFGKAPFRGFLIMLKPEQGLPGAGFLSARIVGLGPWNHGMLGYGFEEVGLVPIFYLR